MADHPNKIRNLARNTIGSFDVHGGKTDYYVGLPNLGTPVFEFSRTNYPSCCGIQILHGFYANRFTQHMDEIVESFFKSTATHWCNKTQIVAVREKIIEWDEDDDGEEIAETVGHEENFMYNDFVVAVIKHTKAKLISEFLNKNSGNMCYVYEFNGENV